VVTQQEIEGERRDLAQEAHEQIVAHIQSRYTGHGLTRLVDAVLRADGWVTRVSPPGPDGGVDILSGRGSPGLDQPKLCVQVLSGEHNHTGCRFDCLLPGSGSGDGEAEWFEEADSSDRSRSAFSW